MPETVLIVDDTPENLRVLSELLQPAYVVRAANSGARALEVVRTAPIPDLILLDVMMPDMDGYECLRRLRDDPRTRGVPVIFVTALDGAEDERHGLALGAVDYITKPVRPAIVEARVRTHLDLKRARDRLRDHNAFLEAELSRFLDVLAHHLQEPVRRQVIFSQMLRRALPEILNEPAEAALAQIVTGATRLRAMLNDVRHYLSVHPEPADGPCSATEACDSACGQVHDKIAAAAAKVIHGELPAVWMARERLADVFRALIDNALDYRHPDRAPRIGVTAQVTDGEVIFAVADNGIGIPAEYRDRLFQVFERLHADDARAGTGIGLALVRKVVEGARGRVWIEDGDDGGTRVRFAVPVGPPAGAGTS